MRRPRFPLSFLPLAALVAVAWVPPAFAQEAPHQHPAEQPETMEDHSSMDMPGMEAPAQGKPMDVGSMQGGKAPADARNSDDYADGYRNSALPGYEMADKLSIPKVLIDELEFATGNEGDGIAWSVLITKGQDDDKLWIRSQGLKNSRERLDPETSAELLWWHSAGPFWGTLAGVRQDIGRGATTWLAAGIEGLAPYWFGLQLTGYVGTDGRLAARAKASYELLFTNRLILTPQAETNLYSKRSNKRELGSGFSNVELSARLRYEISRKVAPYVGYVWERSLGGTADFKRREGGPVAEHRFVAGVRLWW